MDTLYGKDLLNRSNGTIDVLVIVIILPPIFKDELHKKYATCPNDLWYVTSGRHSLSGVEGHIPNFLSYQSYLPKHQKHCCHYNSETVIDREKLKGGKYLIAYAGTLLHLSETFRGTFKGDNSAQSLDQTSNWSKLGNRKS